MTIFHADMKLDIMVRLEIDALNKHAAREEAARLQSALLDEVRGWPMTELECLDMKFSLIDVA